MRPFLKLGLCLFYSAITIAEPMATNITHTPLAPLDQNRKPWTLLDSEQPVLYVGNTPREMELGLPPKPQPILGQRLRVQGENEFQRLRSQLKLNTVELEVWPGYDGWGMVTWVVARYRKEASAHWQWFDQSYAKPESSSSAAPTQILLPLVMDWNKAEDRDQIFNQSPTDLYQRPDFENIVWLNSNRSEVYTAWQKYGTEKQVQTLCETKACIPVSLHLPANFNDQPISFVVGVTRDKISWPPTIAWQKEIRSPAKVQPRVSLELPWPADFKQRFLHSVRELTGELPVFSPLRGEAIDFLKQSSGQKDNQLLDTLAHLAHLHQVMGYEPETGKKGRFEYEIQSFAWQGIPQQNLIVKIRGLHHDQPIILSGHYDKAIAEDTYQKSGGKIRETTPGADDNATAIATLLNGAALFLERYRNRPPLQDIYLVHFTGEEFPAGCLGARHYISRELLAKRRDIRANINLDMIGHRTTGDLIFQINPGFGESSWKLAEIAYSLALELSRQSPLPWKPMVRWPWSKQSYLTQTDSAIFDWAGYPTLLFNEHINLARKQNPYYHQSSDVSGVLDLDYAVVQAKTALATAVYLAELK